MSESGKRPELERVLGLWAAVAMVVGTTIGSGIFRVPSAMVAEVGSPAMVAAVWVFGGVLTLFGALTYAELAAALPEAGGEYVYLKEAYGRFFGFLYGWTQTWVAKSASIATLATAFADYLEGLSPAVRNVLATIDLPIGPGGDPLTINVGQLLAIGVILGLGLLNVLGVRLGGGLQVGVTIAKVALIAVIIAVGLTSSIGATANFSTTVPVEGKPVARFFAALVAALWAYDGWNNVAMIASEVKEPRRNLPRALIGGTIAIIAIYLLANLAYFYVLTSSEVAASRRVAATMMERIAGARGAQAVSLVVMVSIFAAINGSILSGSRVPYALARDGLFFRPFARVSNRRTPSVAIILLSLWASVLVLSGRYEQLYTLVIFPSWILYAMAAASVIVLRVRRPELARPYRTLGYPVVPIVFVLVAVALLYSTYQESPRESKMGLFVIAAGLPFYWYWSRRSRPIERVQTE